MIDYEKSNIRIKTEAGEYHLVRDRKDVENLPIHNRTISKMISKLSETAKLREKIRNKYLLYLRSIGSLNKLIRYILIVLLISQLICFKYPTFHG